MAHIQKTKSGTWKATIYTGKDPSTGKYQRKSRTFDSKKEAEYWAAKTEVDKQDGINLNPEQYTVAEYLRQWLSDYAEVNLAATTYDDYRQTIEGHIIPAIGQIKLTELKPTHIQHYQSNKLKKGKKRGEGGLSSTTVKKHHRILNKALKQATLLQLIKSNPCSPVPAPRARKKEVETMNFSEIQKLLKLAEDKWIYYPLTVAIYTGIRRSELMALKWKDVDFGRKKMKIKRGLVRKTGQGLIFKDIPKTNSSRRTIDISSTVIFALKKLKSEQNEKKLFLGDKYVDNDLIFCNEDGSKRSPNWTGRLMKRLLKDTELENYTLHSLRHTHATLMLEKGVAVKVVQERLGHSTSTTTNDIYVHATETMQREAADIFEKSL